MAHTKGPWFAEHLNSQTNDIIHIHNGKGKVGEIASIYRAPFKTEYIDNAKLMAAAPRMKQLLEIWANLSSELAAMPGHHEDHDDILAATEQLLREIQEASKYLKPTGVWETGFIMKKNHLSIVTGENRLDLNDPLAFKKVADQMKADLPDLPVGHRTPTELEVMQMSAYATAYRKGHPQATDRMVRRAVQKKFKVKIIK